MMPCITWLHLCKTLRIGTSIVTEGISVCRGQRGEGKMGTNWRLTDMRLFGVMHKTVNMIKTTERTSKTQESGGQQVTALSSVEEDHHCHISGSSTGGLTDLWYFLTCLPLLHNCPREGESGGCGYQVQGRKGTRTTGMRTADLAAQEASMVTGRPACPAQPPTLRPNWPLWWWLGSSKAVTGLSLVFYLLRLSRGQHKMGLILGDGPNVIHSSVST